jgi:hypothetical protein
MYGKTSIFYGTHAMVRFPSYAADNSAGNHIFSNPLINQPNIIAAQPLSHGMGLAIY